MDVSQQKHLEALNRIFLKRLRFLELQAARSGPLSEVAILMEIDDLRERLSENTKQLADLHATAGYSNPEKILTAESSSEARKSVEIFLRGNLANWTPDIKSKVIEALAAVMEIPSDQIAVLQVLEGSIILLVEVPAKAADLILTLDSVDDHLLRGIGVIKVKIPGDELSEPTPVEEIKHDVVRKPTERLHSIMSKTIVVAGSILWRLFEIIILYPASFIYFIFSFLLAFLAHGWVTSLLIIIILLLDFPIVVKIAAIIALIINYIMHVSGDQPPSPPRPPSSPSPTPNPPVTEAVRQREAKKKELVSTEHR